MFGIRGLKILLDTKMPRLELRIHKLTSIELAAGRTEIKGRGSVDAISRTSALRGSIFIDWTSETGRMVSSFC